MVVTVTRSVARGGQTPSGTGSGARPGTGASASRCSAEDRVKRCHIAGVNRLHEIGHLSFLKVGCVGEILHSKREGRFWDFSALECREQSAECLRLREQSDILPQRATILLTNGSTLDGSS
jgi:hypothetical protein